MERTLSGSEIDDLIAVLANRFERHLNRHPELPWSDVSGRLETANLWPLAQMEATGGEPDVVSFRPQTDQFVFVDCAPESPAGRRSLCYDQAALDQRKKFKPEGSAVATAAAMGVELLTEEQYRRLQQLGEFDAKTSSWVQTPDAIRTLGGALFCDRRYGTVFVYHNGADSYYASRGFRAMYVI